MLVIVSTAAEAREPGLYAELKTWQTGIGAFLGLVAIIAGALYNAKLNRDRDIRLRRQEIRGLCHALAAELTASYENCVSAAARIQDLQKDKKPITDFDIAMTERPVSAIYEANLNKIGLLAELASDVVSTYEELSRVQFNTDQTVKILKPDKTLSSDIFDVDRHWLTPGKKAQALARRLDVYEPPDG